MSDREFLDVQVPKWLTIADDYSYTSVTVFLVLSLTPCVYLRSFKGVWTVALQKPALSMSYAAGIACQLYLASQCQIRERITIKEDICNAFLFWFAYPLRWIPLLEEYLRQNPRPNGLAVFHYLSSKDHRRSVLFKLYLFLILLSIPDLVQRLDPITYITSLFPHTLYSIFFNIEFICLGMGILSCFLQYRTTRSSDSREASETGGVDFLFLFSFLMAQQLMEYFVYTSPKYSRRYYPLLGVAVGAGMFNLFMFEAICVSTEKSLVI